MFREGHFPESWNTLIKFVKETELKMHFEEHLIFFKECSVGTQKMNSTGYCTFTKVITEKKNWITGKMTYATKWPSDNFLKQQTSGGRRVPPTVWVRFISGLVSALESVE